MLSHFKNTLIYFCITTSCSLAAVIAPTNSGTYSETYTNENSLVSYDGPFSQLELGQLIYSGGVTRYRMFFVFDLSSVTSPSPSAFLVLTDNNPTAPFPYPFFTNLSITSPSLLTDDLVNGTGDKSELFNGLASGPNLGYLILRRNDTPLNFDYSKYYNGTLSLSEYVNAHLGQIITLSVYADYEVYSSSKVSPSLILTIPEITSDRLTVFAFLLLLAASKNVRNNLTRRCS